jgi:hypothetical protein
LAKKIGKGFEKIDGSLSEEEITEIIKKKVMLLINGKIKI